jgi:hypothetical protein
MGKFMNNRIGSFLTELEVKNINKMSRHFSKNDIVVYEEAPDTYKFVLLLSVEQNNNNNNSINNAIIISKENNNLQRIQIPLGNLYEYSKHFPIKQDYTTENAGLDENHLLESYIM